MKTIALIGNPNCGKTTIFNSLTGSKQSIGNWPGVTVEKVVGVATLSTPQLLNSSTSQHPDTPTLQLFNSSTLQLFKVIDLPGVYSLTATSEDERATLEYILSHEADLYVNVLDATTLERSLYLTLLLCELKVPMIIVVTMMDIARHRNLVIELDHLSTHLGVPVIGINANSVHDINRLKRELASVLGGRQAIDDLRAGAPNSSTLQLSNSSTLQLSNSSTLLPTVKLEYGDELEREIDLLASCTVKTAEALKVSREWVALKALEGEPLVTKALQDYHDMAPEVIEGAIARVTQVLADPPDIELAEARYGIIAGLVRDVVRVRPSKMYFSEIIDRFVLNRFLGMPLFLVIMVGVFGLVSTMGGAPTEFFHDLGSLIFQRVPGMLVSGPLGAPDWVSAVVVAVGGAFNILFSFIPVIFTMFLALAILEDSGYIARAAFLADRLMRGIGLPGKSFVPLLVGFGCTVPAILATRMLESRRDRLLTVFLIPFMSCGAKLPVYAAFAVAFSPDAPWKLMLALYLVGLALGTLVGLVLKKTLFRGTPAHFIMELPPYHLPRPRHFLRHAGDNLVGFLWRAGKFIVPMMLVLGLLNSFDVHGHAKVNGDVSSNTMLSAVGRACTPVFEPIGVEQDNWEASVAIFTGLFAKESVIGTLNGLYSQSAALKQSDGEGVHGEEYAAAKSSELAERNELRRHFSKGFHQAFAYLLFILLYVPCVGATAVVFKEIGKAYGAVFVCYLTALGWSVATMYHAVMVSRSPLWLGVGLGVIAAMFTAFWLCGRYRRVDLV